MRGHLCVFTIRLFNRRQEALKISVQDIVAFVGNHTIIREPSPGWLKGVRKVVTFLPAIRHKK